MAGTKEGGQRTREKNLAKDPNYYSKMGAMGAEAYRKRQKQGIAQPRGFAAMSKEKIRAAGKKGGRKSKRTKSE